MKKQIETLFLGGDIELAVLLANSQNIDILTLNINFSDMLNEPILILNMRHYAFDYRENTLLVAKGLHSLYSLYWGSNYKLTNADIDYLKKHGLMLGFHEANRNEKYFSYGFEIVTDKDILFIIKFIESK